MNYDRIILELLDRVAALEEEVKQLKSASQPSNDSPVFGTPSWQPNAGRDTTKYMMDGIRYGKNRLVLAIIKKYMKIHPETSASTLMTVFDKSLQGSLGVVRTVSDIKNSYTDCERRFFLRKDEIIPTTTETCAVCSQWGAFNINNLISRAKELDIEVQEIK